jgi:hypothetical protein
MSRHGSVRSSVRAFLVFACFLLQAASFAAEQGPPVEKATTAEASSTNLHPVFVELFTSEGCSSCPPADVLLKKWDTFQPVPGAQLIVLSEHVNYWDHDGWKDPNSSAALTERQSSYVSVLHLKGPYTPQMIVDGSQEVHLEDALQMEGVLQKAAAAPRVSVRIGEVTADAGDPTVLHARIDTDANFDKHNADVYLAVALDHVESQVLKGENGGKHLVHVAVVQELTKVGKLPKGKSFGQDVQIKLKPGTDAKNIRLVAFVQEPGPGRLLGAALRKPAI